MTRPSEASPHGMMDVGNGEPNDASPSRGPGPLALSSGRGFLVCAAVAIGYGLWALYGSGSRLLSLDVLSQAEGAGNPPGAARFELDPGMNPLRAVLHAAHAPVSSSRLHYEFVCVDGAGRLVWESTGFLGSSQDDASIVKTTTELATFDAPRHGEYFLRARAFGTSMDDLRELTIELRRNVVRVDTRITWGFGLAAVALLITSLVASRRLPPHDRAARHEPPRAA